ncbi:GH39 family glycosyl hydrolase [Paenibacillus terrigena]|uniref:GH39 family glycosyl hydrolase n=1 Tax=Paenibacillus terrigena TaxID=369333 RepID=UPI0028D84F0A|nr:helix-turn-helix domain-containing protein [Paenibacillus terrigena]
MKYSYEVITTSDYIPFRLLLHRPNRVLMHWHENMEILFVLRGSVELFRKQERHVLKESDITVINSKEIHSISGDEESLLLALQVSKSYLEQQFAPIKDIQFRCDSYLYDAQHQVEFDTIRQILAYMMLTYTKQAKGYELELKGLLFRLISYLVRHYGRESSALDSSSEIKYMDRLMAITEYIQQNYAEPVSLTEIAEQEFLSVHYLSRFFQKVLGTTFSNYLNGVRLEHAMIDLLYSELPITQIALKNGFPSIKAFNKVFKDFYIVAPREYRLQHASDVVVHSRQRHSITPNYLEMNQQDAFKALFKYLPEEQDSPLYRHQDKMISKSDTIDLEKAKERTAIQHTWKRLTSIGKAKEGLFHDVQQHLTQIQQDIGFTHIRFHGLFDDEMMVYHEDSAGRPFYHFFYIDRLFDFLLRIGLKPFIELGFMPSMLASKDVTIFAKKSIVSYPKSLKRWTELVRALVDHCIARYGAEEVATWYFEVWNEPDVTAFWHATKEQYFEFYHATHQVIREYPDLKVGGPSLLSLTIMNDPWLLDFLKFCKQQDCIPDFISYHSYPFDQILYDALQSNTLQAELFDWNTEDLSKFYWIMSEAHDYLAQVIAKGYRIIADAGVAIGEVHITEWNSSGNQRDLIHDTCYQSAYIVKNVVDNLDAVDSLCYWTCTDLLEEFTVSDDLFHGGLGLVTNTGIPKPAYYAYQLLGQLGDELIQRGEHYCITKRGDEVQVLLFHYVHTDHLYRHNDVSHLTPIDRYRIFEHTNPLQLTLALTSMLPGVYEIRKTTLNRQYGSSFDKWVEMGHPDRLQLEDEVYLKQVSQPKREVFRKQIDAQFNVRAELAPHEVQLYRMKWLHA